MLTPCAIKSYASSAESNRVFRESNNSSTPDTNLSSLREASFNSVRRRDISSSMRLTSSINETDEKTAFNPVNQKSKALKMSQKHQLAFFALAMTGIITIFKFRPGNNIWEDIKDNNLTNIPDLHEMDQPNHSGSLRGTNSSHLQFDKSNNTETNKTTEIIFQHDEKHGCSIPNSYGGWHEGRFIANLINSNGWTWKQCAAECAKSEECEFWTLPINGNYESCLLVADKGQYHESGYHVEGDRDLNCLNTQEPVVGQEIKSIYYINLEKNKLRKQSMEEQLSKQDIPFHRVNALAGNENHTCSGGVSGAKCKGVAGLTLSNLEIIDHGDHSKGLTLVLEDDVFVKDMGILMSSVEKVPKNWDIIRWNCIAEQWIPATFQRINKYVFQTRHAKPCDPTPENLWCNFYGGTYAMLWRNSSLGKLRDVWSVEPFSDIDGRLTTDRLNSYCVDVGNQVMHQPPKQEMSDIQLDNNGTVNINWG